MLLDDNIDKKSDGDLNARVGDLMTRISIYEQKEISWGFYGENNGNSAFVLIMPYANNDSRNTDDGVSQHHGGSSYTLLYGNHTHPDIFDNNSEPSPADMRNGDAKIANYIWSNTGVSQYASKGKVPQKNGNDLVRDYTKDRMKSTYNMDYLKNTLKWKKKF